jgi:hypothetical protein
MITENEYLKNQKFFNILICSLLIERGFKNVTNNDYFLVFFGKIKNIEFEIHVWDDNLDVYLPKDWLHNYSAFKEIMEILNYDFKN